MALKIANEKDAIRLANAAKRRAKKAGRAVLDAEDFAHAAETVETFLVKTGFGWLAGK